MRNYSGNLYKKFKTRTMNTLDGDHFYEYFMRVVESGQRFYGQKNETQIKIIDEKWVKAIEKALVPLETITKKPRRFIKREENILPVELARKVGSDAVKHLATHTHFINHVNDSGDVIPNKILNVYSEDSILIYENRFVYTLINKIGEFLDRRYDALFGTTGDEFESVLKIDSTFNDNDEKIEYNLILKVHQGQQYLDNQSNDPLIYDRIEHIRTMVNGFKKTEFYLDLLGCERVKSPISKTNLIAKEPNFKKCYELWNFLEKYTDVGYSIQKRQFNTDFTDNYVDELNTIILFNYLIMKKNMEPENDKLLDITKYKKKRTIKPKFISRIIEEFVSEYDITEDEMKQVFAAEIGRAYSLKVNEEEEIQKALEKALSAELSKNKEAQQEEQIKRILEETLTSHQENKEQEEQEEQIKSVLERTLGVIVEKSEKERQEEQIKAALERALGNANTNKQEESIKSALERALEAHLAKKPSRQTAQYDDYDDDDYDEDEDDEE